MTARPPIPEPPYAGGCLCGAVRYALNLRPLTVSACHCTDCKRLTGATNNLSITALRSGLEHTGETDRFRKTAESGRQADVVRCATCGTRLWHEPQAMPDRLFLMAGTLDDSSWAIPVAHIWVEKASPDAKFRDDAEQREGQPADRSFMVEAFNRIYGAP
jgi:hypothetical protein